MTAPSCHTDLSGTWCNAGELVDLELAPIFSDENTDYVWEYTNEGLRLARMRFCPLPSAEIGDCTRDARI